MKASLTAALVALCLSALAGCASSATSVSNTPTSSGTTPGNGCSTPSAYHVGPGDVLAISVWENKNLDRVATVRPDGKISFPLINDIRVAGDTPEQIQKLLDNKLQRYISHPRVSVVVQKTRNVTASVLGEVNQPGSYPIRVGDTTVLDMLAQAGGFTNFADKGSISVIRKEADGTHRIHFRYFKAISGQPGASDFCVQPGDIVMIR